MGTAYPYEHGRRTFDTNLGGVEAVGVRHGRSSIVPPGAPMSVLIKILVTAVAVWVAVQVVDGLEFTGDVLALLAIAVILGVVNAFARPIVTLLSLPIVLLTLGLFLLIINALMFALTIWISESLNLGLTSTGFGATLLGAIIVSVVSWIGEALLGVD